MSLASLVSLEVSNQREPFDLSKINKNPYNTEFVGIGADQTNLFGYRVPDEIIKAQEERLKNIGPIDFSGVVRSPESSIPGYGKLLPQFNATPPAISLLEQTPLSGIQTPPSAMPTVPMVEGAVQTPLSGDQGLMDRLTSLEQGIGSLQNQIANLFQMRQASDPFGLGGFINTRRY